MQLYKKRDFGELITDAFNFFKVYGKNYFKNYFLINGLFLILIVVLVVIGFGEFFSQLFGSNIEGEGRYFEQYFQENQALLILVSALIFVLFLVAMIINYAYPVLYLKRLGETEVKQITSDAIISDLRSNAKRLFFLFLGLLFVVTPLAFILIGLSTLLISVIIGLFILLFIVPVIANIIIFLMYDFLHSKRNFFESFSYAIRSQFSYLMQTSPSPFWKYWGATTINYLIMQLLSSIFSIIPFVLIMLFVYTTPDSERAVENTLISSGFQTSILVGYSFAILFSLIIGNIIYVSIGLMYFDSRTDLHRKVDLQQIDSIGQNEG